MEDPTLDAALFFAVYLGMVGVVFAMGEPQDRTEKRWRHVTLIFCAILAIVMIMWLVVAVLGKVAAL
jgi:uncharacterized membrane protein